MSRASEYRKKRQTADEPTAELTLPSGAVFTVRRPPLETWIAFGRVPQSFLVRAKEAGKGQTVTADEVELVPTMIFLRDAITYACVDPRLVAGGTGEDEMDPNDLDPVDFEFLSKWIMLNCPGVPVRTKGGEVTIDNLDRFQQKRPGGKPFSLEPDIPEVRDEAERYARPA